ncbi:MAG: ABC transporter ATP-binding protein [Anaerolineae bacterium]|nr:ABC transporter ATP-binding protein [Anaerolineae bacterium]
MRGDSTGAARPPSSFPQLMRGIRYIGRFRQMALVAYGSLVVATLAQLAIPQLIQNIMDAITSGYVAHRVLELPLLARGLAATAMGTTLDQLQRDADTAFSALLGALAAIIAFAVARATFSFLRGYFAEKLSQYLAYDFRNELYEKIQRLSFSYHDRNQTGQLMVRATDDVERLRLFIGQGLTMLLESILLLVATLLILLTTNWQITLVVLPTLPIALVLFLVFGMLAQPLFGELQKRLSALNTVLQENLAGLKLVKAFVQEPKEQARFESAVDSHLQQALKVARVFSFLFPVVFLVASLGQVAVLYFGGQQIVYGTLTIGEWQKFSLYLMYVFFPLGQLGMIVSLMSQAAASAQRVFDILDAENEVTDRPGAVEMPPIKGRVAFEHVTFRYFKSGEPVLNDVSFVAEPGQTVALLGATGSGKTTIINLIPRFYDVSEGRITIDGQDIRDVTIASLRRQIGIVLQEATLFSGTIRENIAFGRPNASQEEIEAAARAAAAHDFIMEFPQGYDTLVGERGSTLSGGQKQRIAIARALLMDPRILILDDSTSSVDVTTEYYIQQALKGLMQGRTSFVIAQRISTVVNADQILVLDKGRIVAAGKHEDLLESSELYAEIYTSQLVEDTTLADDDESAVLTAGQEVA